MVFRVFDNGDAMVAALQRVRSMPLTFPPESFEGLDADPDIVAVVGLRAGSPSSG